MKTRIIITFLLILFTAPSSFAQNISLSKPNLKGGMSMMETLSKRRSTREFSTKELSKGHLSGLLWAANGINRKDGKRTAPSAKNMQEISIYAFTKAGVFLYDAKKNTLKLVVKGDRRKLIAEKQASMARAPISLLYVADVSKLVSFGKEHSLVVAGMDAGAISQNVNLFCASAGLVTVPRTTMDVKGIRKTLKLSSKFVPLLNNVIGYRK